MGAVGCTGERMEIQPFISPILFPLFTLRSGQGGYGVRIGTRIMIFKRRFIPTKRRIKLNETDNLENENTNEQTVSSNEVSEITEDSKEQTEQPKETEQDSYSTTNTETLVEQVSQINQKLDTVSNILIVSMVGMAILVGITACNIFSRYFKS